MEIHVTHIGTATVLFELPGITILTDPVFGGPCDCHFGWGMRSRHRRGPWIDRSALPAIDLALVSHDQHTDNLDEEGRAVIASATEVLTTRAAARRLGGRAEGLRAFESRVFAKNGLEVRVTGTPARHGPPLSLPFVGPVIGFVLEWSGQRHGSVYISGDTVRFGGTRRIAERFRIGTAFLHLGAASYAGSRFTMDAREGALFGKELDARTLVPVHYDEWTHFAEPADRIAPAFTAAGIGDRMFRLAKGARTALEV